MIVRHAKEPSKKRTSPLAIVIASLLAVASMLIIVVGVQTVTNPQSGYGMADGGVGEDGALTVPSAQPTPTNGYEVMDASTPLVLVNKHNPLFPVDFEPSNLLDLESIQIPGGESQMLSHDAAYSMQEMFAVARYEYGINLQVESGYRSAAEQAQLYEAAVSSLGQEAADRTVERPAYSEHQTGFGVDLSDGGECALQACFAQTAAAEWLAEHAWQYGFIVRYPAGSEDITGFEAQPWHLRYLGIEATTAMHESGAATYEEFLGMPGAPNYL